MSFFSKIGDAFLMVLAYPIVLLYVYACNNNDTAHIRELDKRARQHEKEVKKAMVERKKMEPKKLCFNRPEIALTTTSTPHLQSKTLQSFSLRQNYDSDPLQDSRLLKLPFELRERIFTEVLGNDTLHITQLPKRLGHIRCTSPPIKRTHSNIICSRTCFHPNKPVQNYRPGEPLDHDATSEDSLSLLRTCRQIYHEASSILYTTNTFDINHPQTLLFLARTIRPSRLASIKHLNLTWSGILPFIEKGKLKESDDLETWEETWRIIASEMGGLKTLSVRMLIHDDEWEKMRSGPFLKYARKRWTGDGVQFEKLLGLCKENVRGLKTFRLGLEMPEEVTWDVGELEEKIGSMVCKERVDRYLD